MSAGERRNAELSRAVILAAAGGMLIGVSQQGAEFAGPLAQVMLIVGAVVVLGGLVLAIRTFIRRSGGADQ